MSWVNSGCTFVWIFSVGRGICAFIRTGLNQGFFVDAVSSSSSIRYTPSLAS
jgi:hypothetical protein